MAFQFIKKQLLSYELPKPYGGNMSPYFELSYTYKLKYKVCYFGIFERIIYSNLILSEDIFIVDVKRKLDERIESDKLKFKK